jgi:hypothetical protein
MKRIKYYYNIPVNNGTEKNPEWVDNLFEKSNPWNEATEEIAKKEAYNGEYEIFDDGQPEPEPAPSTEELEAENEDMRNALGVLGVTV